MKQFYISLMIFTIAGLTAGYLIRPSRTEIALMYFKDRHYGKALQMYEELLAESNYSPDVIKALAKLNLNKGDIERSAVFARHSLATLDAQ